ncbi:ABC transporter permease [Salinibacterium sp. UTAS2018]|uniref:FtsX-like permease family protein n=1 Tax=Salinibacterium sp. UTAS2018 TaxID=2508880 RepID=UPI0010093F4B|nr:ABC transporter permease [Salinibacterium sp. UTAS2018]QAV70767.1 ABC transporter permease [Salinibacterium sp. UTAS2018]
MFVAWRDLRFARGRFVLIGTVVALITLLVGFLSGLTGGLAAQNISGVLSLPADQLVFATPSSKGADEASFSDSNVTEKQATTWADAAGVDSANPIGVSQTKAESPESSTSIAIFGVVAGFDETAPSGDGKVGLSEDAATALDVSTGDTITVAGTEYTVEKVSGNWWYNHTPVVQMTLEDWQGYSATTGNPDAYATAIAVNGDADWSAINADADTLSNSVLLSLTAVSSFRSEIGSLLLMVAMLFGISALVIGAFFTVWTMQRKADIAMLKALGASTSSLIRDALGQALIVLLIGVGIGIGITALLGVLMGSALPFILSPFTTLLPGVIMIALGLAGAAFALRSVTTADPLTALGSTR